MTNPSFRTASTSAAFPAPRLHSIMLACALSLGGYSLPSTTWAQAGSAATALATARSLQLPAQPLGQTLNALAREWGVAISADAALVAGRTAPAQQGTLNLAQALAAALAGSGLTAVNHGTAITVQRAATGDAALATVTVSAQADTGSTTEGTGSYTTRSTGAGTRMALSLRETPQSVSVIGRQQIEEQNLGTLVDVLRQTPGIVADRLDERVSFSSRGFALGTMVDGVPTLSYNSIAGETSMISTQLYDRVEVIRGAAGLLNGVGAPGGSVNLVRKRPGREFSGHVAAGIGSWSRYSGEADLGGPLNADATVRGRIVASHTAGNSFVDAKSQREEVFYGILEADLGPQTLLSLGAEHQKTAIDGANFGQSPLFYNDKTPTQLPRSFNSSTPWSVWNMTTQRVFANLEHQLDNGWRLKVDAAYARNERERYSGDVWLYPANLSAQNPQATVQLANNPADASNKSLDLYANGPFQLFGREHQASVGANINRYSYNYGNWSAVANAFDRRTVDLFNLGAIARPDFVHPLNHFDGSTEEKAVFGALRFKPTDSLALIAGSRFSWYKNQVTQRLWTNGSNGAPVVNKPTQEDAVFTPYLGVIYDLHPQYSVYASYTDIFQPNTARDSSNQILDPRRGTNTELGLKGEHWGGKLNTSVSVFRTQEDNVATLDTGAPALPDGTTPYRAVKGARSKGYEFTASGELARGWQVMGGYTYHAKRDATGLPLNANYPRRMLRIATSYRLPGQWNALTVGGSLSYQSDIAYTESYGTGRASQAGLTLIGLMARYDVNRQLSLALNIENLTDKTYYAGLGGYNGYTQGAPRNTWLRAHYRF